MTLKFHRNIKKLGLPFDSNRNIFTILSHKNTLHRVNIVWGVGDYIHPVFVCSYFFNSLASTVLGGITYTPLLCVVNVLIV